MIVLHTENMVTECQEFVERTVDETVRTGTDRIELILVLDASHGTNSEGWDLAGASFGGFRQVGGDSRQSVIRYKLASIDKEAKAGYAAIVRAAREDARAWVERRWGQLEQRRQLEGGKGGQRRCSSHDEEDFYVVLLVVGRTL